MTHRASRGFVKLELVEDPLNVRGQQAGRVEPPDLRPDIEVEQRRFLADREAALDRERVLPDRQSVRFDRQTARRFRKSGVQDPGHRLIFDEAPVDAEKSHVPGKDLQPQPGPRPVGPVVDGGAERVDDEVKQLPLTQVLGLEVDATQLDVTYQDRGSAAARFRRRAGGPGF